MGVERRKKRRSYEFRWLDSSLAGGHRRLFPLNGGEIYFIWSRRKYPTNKDYYVTYKHAIAVLPFFPLFSRRVSIIQCLWICSLADKTSLSSKGAYQLILLLPPTVVGFFLVYLILCIPPLFCYYIV